MVDQKKNTYLFINLFLLFSGFVYRSVEAKTPLLCKNDLDIEIDAWGIYKPELFAGKNFTFLNNNNPEDVVVYNRHTNDWFINMVYGNATYGYPVIEFRSGLRNRAIWGSPATIAYTLPTETHVAGIPQKPHLHSLPRLFFWLRESWMKISLNDLLNLSFENNHTFTLGAFPFELGRGIALGSAYAAGPGPLGFFADSAIDQYAFGFKLSGDIVEDVLAYDLYASILQARSASIVETSKNVFENEIGRRLTPDRGFGNDNYLFAARLLWTPLRSDCWGLLTFEPYVMYNNDPEQRIEFNADAESKLGTFGLAGEYIGKRFECGFDAAYNMGAQYVRPWDRNYSVIENIDGDLVALNSRVTMQSNDPAINGKKAPYVPKSKSQELINEAADTGSHDENGKIISGADHLSQVGFYKGDITLLNANNRFRDTYKNTYHGFMVVGDASYWICPKELQVAVTAGIASGDEDPNREVKDGTFDGFIGLQEVYQGKRVKSVFLLGTVGKAKRPGTLPENPLSPRDSVMSNSGFTNLILLGAGTTWKPSWSQRRLLVNPNFFVYWSDVPGDKFDAKIGKHVDIKARRFLGFESNIFLSCFPMTNLKFFTIGSFFVPGGFFTDKRGLPVTHEQKKNLKCWQDKIKGIDDAKDLIPNLGNNIGYTINVGLEFAF